MGEPQEFFIVYQLMQSPPQDGWKQTLPFGELTHLKYMFVRAQDISVFLLSLTLTHQYFNSHLFNL
jgi:hypothetical protein